jgi:hypothetical protein
MFCPADEMPGTLNHLPIANEEVLASEAVLLSSPGEL